MYEQHHTIVLLAPVSVQVSRVKVVVVCVVAEVLRIVAVVRAVVRLQVLLLEVLQIIVVVIDWQGAVRRAWGYNFIRSLYCRM